MKRARRTALLSGGLFAFSGLLVGCLERGSATPDTDPPVVLPEDNPVLTALNRACDPVTGQWVVEARTDNPSNGLVSWWSLDGQVVERHVIPVVESAADGSWDRMFKILPQVSDWREQVPSASTRFTCAQPVTTLFWVENPLGARIQCDFRGPDPAVFDGIEGIPACPP